MLMNKKGEIGETMTWLVATIIIIVVLIIFLFVSSALAETKSVGVDSGSVDRGERDFIEAKTESALSINSANKGSIEDWIGRIIEYG